MQLHRNCGKTSSTNFSIISLSQSQRSVSVRKFNKNTSTTHFIDSNLFQSWLLFETIRRPPPPPHSHWPQHLNPFKAYTNDEIRAPLGSQVEAEAGGLPCQECWKISKRRPGWIYSQLRPLREQLWWVSWWTPQRTIHQKTARELQMLLRLLHRSPPPINLLVPTSTCC